ncbi:MAG: glycosyltransferase family 9 protein, partial [Burkholderiaceae bacterium]
GLPEQPVRGAELPRFFADCRRRRFDLALQLHGSGQIVNGRLLMLGARRSCGFTPGDPRVPGLPGFIRWPEQGHEIERLLALTDHLGIARSGTELELPFSADERAAWRTLAAALALDMRRLVLVHPGARLPSRRWPGERYAALADRLHRAGWQIALTGAADEQALTAAVRSVMRAPAVDLTGRTTLGMLAAALVDCRLLVSNDTGVSHVAAAVGAPSVVVANGSDVERWRPLDARRHAVLAEQLPCRPCAHHECPYIDHPCATAISVQAVHEAALRQLAGRA